MSCTLGNRAGHKIACVCVHVHRVYDACVCVCVCVCWSEYECVYMCECGVCISACHNMRACSQIYNEHIISFTQTHSEEQRVLAESLNWFEEVCTDFFISFTSKQHAAL